MRRKLSYLSVALLAFAFGLFVVLSFHWNHSSKAIAQQELIVDEVKPAEKTAVADSLRTDFHCDDKIIIPVWLRLMKDKAFINDAYDNVIGPRRIKNCQELFDVKTINLNDDNSDNFIVIGNQYLLSDSGGDCQTWIVSKRDNRYKIIFYSTAGTSTTNLYVHDEIESLNSKTRGFKDLKVFIPNGWDADNIGYFKFDGSKYRLKKCLKDFNSAYVYQNDYDEKWLGVKSDECLKSNYF